MIHNESWNDEERYTVYYFPTPRNNRRINSLSHDFEINLRAL